MPEAATLRGRLFNLANALTLSRFVAAPFMVALILAMPGTERLLSAGLANPPSDPLPGLAADAWISVAAFILLIATLLTDLFDGLVARRYKVVTNFGKIMDPVADSTFFMTVLFGFSACTRFRDYFPIWLPLIVLYREIGIQVLRRYGALKGMVLAARWSGKAKMAIQSVLMAIWFLAVAVYDIAAWNALSGHPAGEIDLHRWLQAERWLGLGLFWVGIVIVVVNILSLLEYTRDVPKLVDEWNE